MPHTAAAVQLEHSDRRAQMYAGGKGSVALSATKEKNGESGVSVERWDEAQGNVRNCQEQMDKQTHMRLNR